MPSKIGPLPQNHEPLTRLLVVSYTGLDEYIFKPDEQVRCWFCLRVKWLKWGNLIRCFGDRCCKTHYILIPWENILKYEWTLPLEPMERCPKCHTKVWELKPHKKRCFKCKKEVENPGLYNSISPMIGPLARDQYQESGLLNKEVGGPTWKNLLLDPNGWNPRVEDIQVHKLNRRLRAYRYGEQRKLASGRDPRIDYRRVNTTW